MGAIIGTAVLTVIAIGSVILQLKESTDSAGRKKRCIAMIISIAFLLLIYGNEMQRLMELMEYEKLAFNIAAFVCGGIAVGNLLVNAFQDEESK